MCEDRRTRRRIRQDPVVATKAAALIVLIWNADAFADEAKGQADGKASGPGAVEVDEEAAERALERTLVAGGALLLRAGQAEFEPSFNYTYRKDDVPAAIVGGDAIGGPGEDLFIGSRDVERDEFTPSATLRIGLPFDAQVELGLPYNIVRQVTQPADNEDTGHGVGDLSIGFAKTLAREAGWRPDIVGRVVYDSGIGNKSDNNVVLDGGFSDIIAQIVALKRQDPLAFVATASYNYYFEDDNDKPGNQVSLSLGALMATSPETTIRVQLQQNFRNDTEIDGRVVNGSDQNEGILLLGASSILGRGILLDVSAGAGLTDDAPEYFVQVALPIRFNLPFVR